MGLAVAVLYSCKKDGLSGQTPTVSGKSYTAQEMQIWRNLTNFNRKIKSGVRDDGSMTLDSAIWYLEALYNIQEASSVTYNDLVIDTTYYTLQLNENGEVSMSDITTVYNQMVTDMQSKLDGFQTDYKYLILGDLYNSTTERDGTISLGLTRGFGINVLNLYNEFTSQDNWYYGNVLGMCNGDSLWDSDAGYELERRFNNIYVNYSAPHDTVHAINIVPRVAFASEYPDYMYNIVWPNGDTCIDYLDLRSFLVDGHNEILYKYENPDGTGGRRPLGKDFFVCDVTTNDKGAYLDDGLYYHTYSIWYANFVSLPPIEY